MTVGTVSSGLRAREAAYRYEAAGPRLGPFTFEGGPGEVWAVVGSNGAGKSTLFRLLAGELQPAQGSVEAGGRVELVPQGVAIPGRLTVAQTFDYLALLRGVPRSERSANVVRALELVDLTSQANTSVRKLSGGQHRRAVIGQALVSLPDALLMDEPSAGLDLDQRAVLRETIRAVGRERLVMVSSHIVEDLAGVADHVLHLVAGSLVFAGTSADYLADAPGGAINTDAAGSSVEHWTTAYHRWNAESGKVRT